MIRRFCLCLVVFTITSSAPAQPSFPLPKEEPAKLKVGKLGRPEALVFEGLDTFSAEEIREALVKDFDVILASHPQADLKEFAATLKSRIADGYLKHGFPNAKINAVVTSSGDQIQIKIVEGSRYTNGDVKVQAPRRIDASVIRRFLTEKTAYETSKEEAPGNQYMVFKSKSDQPRLWEKGKTTNFGANPSKSHVRAIKAGLSAEGYFFPEFTAEIKPTDNGKAELWVRVTDPGPKASVGTITIEGLKHHTRKQILDYLGIKSGIPVDYEKRIAWERKLRDSLCFLKAKVIVFPAIAPGAPSELRIELVEQPGGPFLDQDLTKNDRIFAKTGQWMAEWNRGTKGDLVVVRQEKKPNPIRIMAIASPKDGLLLDFEASDPEKDVMFRYTIVLSKSETRVVSWHLKKTLSHEPAKGKYDIQFLFDYKPKESGSSIWALDGGYTFHYRTRRDPEDNPIAVSTDMKPSVAIALGRAMHLLNAVSRSEGIVTLSHNGTLLNLDAKTGTIRSVQSTGAKFDLPKLKQSAIPHLKQMGAVGYFSDGAFARCLKQIDAETANFIPSFNPGRPISSILEFFLGDLRYISRGAKKPVNPELLIRLIELDALRPIDRFCVEKNSRGTKKTDSFSLPYTSHEDQIQTFGLDKKLPAGLGKTLARMAFGLHAMIVPRESGPAHVGWNLALLCNNQRREAMIQLNRLTELPEVGPLTCLYAGCVFGMFQREFAGRFARAGLEKLDEETFRREMDHLLPEQSWLTELAGSVAEAVRQLDDDEFAQLALLLGDQSKHPALPKLAEKLRQEKGAPSREFLLDAIETIWRIRGQAYVREQLEKLAKQAPARKPQTTTDLKWLSNKKTKDSKPNQAKRGKDLDAAVEKILKETGVD